GDHRGIALLAQAGAFVGAALHLPPLRRTARSLHPTEGWALLLARTAHADGGQVLRGAAGVERRAAQHAVRPRSRSLAPGSGYAPANTRSVRWRDRVHGSPGG